MMALAEAWGQTQGTVTERLAALRAMSVSVPKPIAASEIKRLWSRWFILARCRLYVADNAPAVIGLANYSADLHELRVVCQATADALQGDVFSDLDPSDPQAEAEMKACLGALQFAGVMTPERVAATWALGIVQECPFASIGLPDLHKAGLITAAEAGVQE